jgi:hypothetical protein
MKINKPSVRGMKHVGYLGRFQKDKFIQDGHNTTPRKEMETVIIGPSQKYEMIGTQDYSDDGEMSSDRGTAVIEVTMPKKPKEEESTVEKNRAAIKRVKSEIGQDKIKLENKRRDAIERIKEELRIEKEVDKRLKMRGR